VSRILGASDQTGGPAAASASRNLAPRGAFGAQSDHIAQTAPELRTEIHSIKREEQRIRAAIKALEVRLAFLDRLGLRDDAPWFSTERAASFDDWVAKNKAAMEGPGCLRQVIENDLSALRDYLRSLRIDERRLERLEVEAEKARRLNETPAQATHDVARIARKFLRKLKKGKLDKKLLAELEAEMDRALKKHVDAVTGNPSVENIKGALYLIGQCQTLGMGGDRTTAALGEIGVQIAKRAQTAEQEFRRNPTMENFISYMHARGQAQVMGEDPGGPSGPPKRLHGDGSYVTQPRDTLRSLSRFFYGNDGWWDVIVGMNLTTFSSLHLKSSDEPLPPGLRLTIPSR
jgi:hypothetical protein